MIRRPPAILALEDGRVFHGQSFGALTETTGEVVFNTSMTGYQEVLSDPSYCGQIVTFTYPLLGNYGVNDEDWESDRLRAQGVVCREVCELPSSWRSQGRLEDLLDTRGVPGICGIDTRALTRHLRDRGVMRGCLSAIETDADALVERARRSPSMLGLGLADLVTCAEPYWWTGESPSETEPENERGRPLAVVYDFGVKYNILRRLRAEGFRVRVVPARTPAADVLAMDPAGVVLSNGPGDPEPLDFAIRAARAVAHAVPTLGICLGHQLIGLAFEGRTSKLKFGHRGINHPVIDRRTGVVEVTSQNHGFAVEPESLPDSLERTHFSGNDRTLEGMVHRTLPVLSCQYHPEASAGPHDSRVWFREFSRLVAEHTGFDWKPKPASVSAAPAAARAGGNGAAAVPAPAAPGGGAVLPDLLKPGLRVVFCGMAAGTISALKGAYYAGPGNKFWWALHQTGVTPERLAPEDYARVLEFGIGLTDLVKTQAGPDAALSRRAYDPAGLRARIEAVRPAALAFNGKAAAEAFLGRRVRAYGEQEERVGGTRVFVLPSTSGAANAHWSLAPWQELADGVQVGSDAG